jgi:hypothetical protein
MVSLELPPLLMQCVLLLPPEAPVSVLAQVAAAVLRPLLLLIELPESLASTTDTTAVSSGASFFARRQQSALQMLRALLCYILPAISSAKRREQEPLQADMLDLMCLTNLVGLLLIAATGALCGQTPCTCYVQSVVLDVLLLQTAESMGAAADACRHWQEQPA